MDGVIIYAFRIFSYNPELIRHENTQLYILYYTMYLYCIHYNLA